MIKISFLDGTEVSVVENIRRKIPDMLENIRITIDRLTLIMQSKIVGEKLSGGVLEHRTGKLASSIRVTEAEISGGNVSGFVEGAGGPAFYGRFHEYGTDRAYEIRPVNAKALAFFPQGYGEVAGGRSIIRNLSSTSRRKQMAAISSFSAQGGVVVKSVMHPPIKERSFMRSTQEEMKDQIIAELEAAVQRTLEGA